MTRKAKKRGIKPRMTATPSVAQDTDVNPPPKMTFSSVTHDAPPVEGTKAPSSSIKPQQVLAAAVQDADTVASSGTLRDDHASTPPMGETRPNPVRVDVPSETAAIGTDTLVQDNSIAQSKSNHDQTLHEGKLVLVDDLSTSHDELRRIPQCESSSSDSSTEAKADFNDTPDHIADSDDQPSPKLHKSESKCTIEQSDMTLTRSPSIFRMLETTPTVGDTPPSQPPSIPPDVAHKVVQHIIFRWMKSAVPLRRLFPPSPSASSHPLDTFLSTLQQANVALKPVEVSALRTSFPPTPEPPLTSAPCLNVTLLVDSVATKLFPIELLEFQLRKAVVAKATKTRGKCDVFKALNQLFDTPTTTDTSVSVALWRSILVEKLALSCPVWVVQCVFCRILAAPLAEMSPRVHFVHCLDRFVRNVQFDTLSVEGVFRSLVQDTDFERGFRAIDADGSGSLSLAECTKYLQTSHQVAFPPAVLQDFLRRFDRDGDGSLNLDEFMACCRPKQHTGVHVLSPYGFFYMTTDPMELVADVVARIHKRLFWLQHNHLLGASPGPNGKDNAAKDNFSLPPKHKLTVDPAKISICRHFGALPLTYTKASDTVQSCLSNGELLVLFETTDTDNQGKSPTRLTCKERHAVQRPPPLRPSVPPTNSVPQTADTFDQPKIEPPDPLTPAARTETGISKQLKCEIPKKKAIPPAVQFPIDVSTWTRMDVKKWLIYNVQVKTLAHKFAAVDGHMLLGWAVHPHLDVWLRDKYSIAQPVLRLRLASHIRQLQPQTHPSTTNRGNVNDDSGDDTVDEKLDEDNTTIQPESSHQNTPNGLAIHKPELIRDSRGCQSALLPLPTDSQIQGENGTSDVQDTIRGNGDDDDEVSINTEDALDSITGDECLPGFSDCHVIDPGDDDNHPPPPFDDPLPGFDD
ncbi:hypothetical protein H257_09745 [Aphanomyces astaci]|uniref:EF-hand domain-containing protein n=1 Tax=Aphanomyces astaci TaxID=112090 RepID=W4GAD6_APHAT|nr:hypothetical protein H257_09745 [Aphanomyces astaci]ETV76256.1 hypothetical protein H257_09745 [Aphanomyces astaci]|eukprot:XP_009834381.1 hypothetical protein H257_09745 [Aphanomyces astaci]